MDEHDKQFESYLRQFRLRKPGPLPEIASLSRRSSMRWVLAAAVIVLIAGLSVLFVRNAGSRAGPKATVEEAGNPSLYRVGETIEAGKVIQSNSAVGLLLALEDGSRVEMHAQSELTLEAAGDGIRVRLNGGSIVVTAAKQGAGHLYVQTRDALVSVVGTVFLVNAEQSGTTVAVVEGEVHVQQGADSKRLLPGDRLATNSSMQLKTVAEQISWSRSASEYVALLQQPAPSSSPVAASQTGPTVTIPANQDQSNPVDMLAKYNEAYKPKILPFKVQANYVRVTSEQVRTLITIQYTNRDLAFRDEGGGKKARAHIEGEIYRIDNRRMPGFSQDVTLEFPARTWAANLDQPTLYQDSRYLTPGKYKVHITVEDMNSQSIGVQDYALNVPRIPDQSLQASSMILAYSITDLPPRMLGTDMFALGEKRVKPNASGVFRSNENLNVWQEIYGLTVDPASRKPSATVQLAILQNGDIKKLSGGSFTEFQGTSPSLTFINSIPLSDLSAGQYDVQIKVTDNFAKVSFVTVGKFAVAGLSVQSDPPRNDGGQQIFYRACTSCHNAQAAMGLGSLASLFSISDRESLTSKQAEMEQLLEKGLRPQHPDIVRVQSEIEALKLREVDAVRGYGSFINSHLTKFGGTIPPSDVPSLAQYLFEESGKKADPPIPSDIPLQKQ